MLVSWSLNCCNTDLHSLWPFQSQQYHSEEVGGAWECPAELLVRLYPSGGEWEEGGWCLRGENWAWHLQYG